MRKMRRCVILSKAKDLLLDSSAFGLRMTLLAGVLCFWTHLAFAWTPQEISDFKKANQSYRSGNFKEAASLYGALSVTHPDSGSLLLNLGNSQYRLGKTGNAILAYERARRAGPRDPDIRYNLNYVRGQLQYKIEDRRNWYLKAFEEVLNTFTGKEILLGALAAYFLFVAAWAFAVFFQDSAPWGFWRKTFLTGALIFAALVGAKNVQAHWLRGAIVTSREAQVRYGPSESDQLAFRLGEGLKLYVMNRRDEWSRVLLTNGESGWVRNDQIEEFQTS